jgi:transposase InsO family protein
MSQSASPSTKKIYGLARVCKIWEMARSTVYWRKTHVPSLARRGPRPWHSDSELLAAIRAFIAESEFFGEGYRKVHAALRFNGLRTSRRRVLRLMRENNLLAPGRVGHAHGPKAHDGNIKTERLNDMWGADMTTTLTTDEGTASIFFAIDHCSLELVGIHAAKRGTRFEALEPLRQGVIEHFGALSEKAAEGLTIRHDHGSQFISNTYQKELRFLGIKSSPSFVRQPQGNGIAERFVRTLKENLLWIWRFATVEELRLALLRFKDTYNHKWMVGRHGYKTPAQVRAAQTWPLPLAA